MSNKEEVKEIKEKEQDTLKTLQDHVNVIEDDDTS
jgi:hypothetical protein